MSTPDQPKRRGRPPSGGREAILDAALALVREEGIAKLTSREIATRAGVSDASIYYHFGDRDGLLLAVFAHGIKPLEFLEAMDPVSSPELEMEMEMDVPAVLMAALQSLEEFYGEVLPVFVAAQADADLARTLAVYRAENDMGPHRGVAALSAYLSDQQAAGRVDPEVDTEAVALLVLSFAYSRASRRLMHLPDEGDDRLPSVDRGLAMINRLLTPPSPRTP